MPFWHGNRAEGMNEIGTAQDAADVLGISPTRVRQLCKAGRVRGAKRMGVQWIIPLPPEIDMPSPSRRRAGVAVDQYEALPEFLKKRLPKAKP